MVSYESARLQPDKKRNRDETAPECTMRNAHRMHTGVEPHCSLQHCVRGKKDVCVLRYHYNGNKMWVLL